MEKHKKFLFGSKEKFAIAGKQWLDKRQTKYIFGEFYFICDNNVIGSEQTVILTTLRYSLESIILGYDYKMSSCLGKQSIENIATLLDSIYVNNYNNPAYEERVEKYETLFLTLDICESLDGTYVFLVSAESEDILLYYNKQENCISHISLPHGNVFSVFRDYIAFIDDLMRRKGLSV